MSSRRRTLLGWLAAVIAVRLGAWVVRAGRRGVRFADEPSRADQHVSLEQPLVGPRPRIVTFDLEAVGPSADLAG